MTPQEKMAELVENGAILGFTPSGREAGGLPEVAYVDYRKALANWTDDVLSQDLLKRPNDV
jgi:hypothetical protein